MSNVFIAFQNNEETRPIVEAILADNPGAARTDAPGMVRIDADGRIVIRRESVEAVTGQPFDLQFIHVNLISLTGHIDEDDDQLTLSWSH